MRRLNPIKIVAIVLLVSMMLRAGLRVNRKHLPERAYRRTLSIGTALRNIGLAAVIASTTFEGSVATAAVLTYLVVQVVVTGVVGVYFKRTAIASETT